MDDLRQKIIEEYTPEYCSLLEEFYGKGMMSEGESEATEHMFSGIELNDKKALDFGSGLGGIPLYLADEHNMDVTGLDINAWMIEEASKRVPDNLKSQLRYNLSPSDDLLNFEDASFDIIYSKGVLTHLQYKLNLFKEFERILKSDGVLVILDPISSVQGQWGPHMAAMADIDELTIFAETKEHYIELLKDAGFSKVEVRDDSELYRMYNEKICTDISETKKQYFIERLGDKDCQDNLQSYQSIVKAFEHKELMLLRFCCYKGSAQ